MPTFKGFTVHITNDRDEPLQEHKVLRHARPIPTGPGTCTTYIESKAGEAFRIAINPSGVVRGRYAWPPAEVWDPDYVDENGYIWPGGPRPNPEVIHFLATLWLDGRPKAEKRLLIYVDPSHPCFTNLAIMKNRRYWDPEEGQLKECGWIFSDIGIEHFLCQLTVSSHGEPSISGTEADGEIDKEVLKRLEELKLESPREDKTKLGCIEITLNEVVLSGDQSIYVPRTLDDGTDGTAVSIADGVSHTVERSEGKVAATEMTTTYYTHVSKDEPPYATFKFFYRSAEIMRKICEKDFEGQAAGSKREAELQGDLRKKRAPENRSDDWQNPEDSGEICLNPEKLRKSSETHEDWGERWESHEGRLTFRNKVWKNPAFP